MPQGPRGLSGSISAKATPVAAEVEVEAVAVVVVEGWGAEVEEWTEPEKASHVL